MMRQQPGVQDIAGMSLSAPPIVARPAWRDN